MWVSCQARDWSEDRSIVAEAIEKYINIVQWQGSRHHQSIEFRTWLYKCLYANAQSMQRVFAIKPRLPKLMPKTKHYETYQPPLVGLHHCVSTRTLTVVWPILTPTSPPPDVFDSDLLQSFSFYHPRPRSHNHRSPQYSSSQKALC